MATDASLIRAPRIWRYPPAGAPLTPGLFDRGARVDLARALAERLGAARVDLLASGREALRRVLVGFAAARERDEVVVPAYTCYSVPAAVVAAGLRVRLVDVTPRGAIDPASLEQLPLERAAAVVVCNLFGVPEPVEVPRRAAEQAGAALVDDAAQTFGARSAEGPVGGRAEAGILSFARGKPLAALGGGAIVWRETPPDPAPTPPQPRRVRAAILALAHDLALAPFAFGWVAALPGLHVGETRFDSEFPHGGLGGEAFVLAQSTLARVDAQSAERRCRAEALAARIADETRFEPLLAEPGQGVYPRLTLRAPDPASRDAALARLTRMGVGASPLYPDSLDGVAPLAPHRVGSGACPGAQDLAARILTVPAWIHSESRRGTRIVAALRQDSDA